MTFFHVRRMGEPLRTGFNFYPRSDTRNLGFVFRLGVFQARFRWSTFRRCLFGSVEYRARQLFGFTFPKPCHRFEAECDWMLMNGIRIIELGESDNASAS